MLRNHPRRVPFRSWASALVLLIGFFIPTLNAQIPTPGVGSSIPPGEEQQAPVPARGARVPTFEFRNGFWVNLHHFLYYQARLQSGLALDPGARPNVSAANALDLSSLSPAERQAWQKAVDYYIQNFAHADLAYDSYLVDIDSRLSDMASCPHLTGHSSPACAAGIDPRLAAVLEQAAPVYRDHWWIEQKRANQVWIDKAVALLRQQGSRPAQALSRAFHNLWPASPIPVDVVYYAGASGSYTTLDPSHILISASSPREQGRGALLGVFREASEILAQPVRDAIVQQCRKQTKPVPRDLWHAVAAYTTAQIFDESFAGDSPPGGDKSFSERNQEYLAARGWQYYEQLIERYWQPYLDHQTEMQTAIVKMVDAL